MDFCLALEAFQSPEQCWLNAAFVPTAVPVSLLSVGTCPAACLKDLVQWRLSEQTQSWTRSLTGSRSSRESRLGWELVWSQIQLLYELLQRNKCKRFFLFAKHHSHYLLSIILPTTQALQPAQRAAYTWISSFASCRRKFTPSIAHSLLCLTLSWSRNRSQWPPTSTAVLMPASQKRGGGQASQAACTQGADSVHQGLPSSCFGRECNFVQGWAPITRSRGIDLQE